MSIVSHLFEGIAYEQKTIIVHVQVNMKLGYFLMDLSFFLNASVHFFFIKNINTEAKNSIVWLNKILFGMFSFLFWMNKTFIPYYCIFYKILEKKDRNFIILFFCFWRRRDWCQ